MRPTALTPAQRLDRLEVRLDDRLEGLGLLGDDMIARERRTLRARYQLIDTASGAIVLDASAGSDAGIDVVQSEYATIAAENTALERLSGIVADEIVASIALYAQRRAAAPAVPAAAPTALPATTPAPAPVR